MADKRISQLDLAGTIDGTEVLPILQNGETVKVAINDLRPYKVYSALLTQSGTDAPVAIVLENTIGDITWSYNDVGDYLGTLVGGFNPTKTWATVENFPPGFNLFNITNTTNDTVNLQSYDITYSPVNEVLYNTPIEIRIYN